MLRFAAATTFKHTLPRKRKWRPVQALTLLMLFLHDLLLACVFEENCHILSPDNPNLSRTSTDTFFLVLFTIIVQVVKLFCRLSSNIQTASVAGYRRRRCAGWSFSLSCSVDTRSLSSPPRNMFLEFQLCVFSVNSPPPPPPPPPPSCVPDCVCEWKNLDDRARHFSLTPWRLSLLSSHDASQIFASNLVACTPWITQASVNLMSNNFVAEIAKFEVQRLSVLIPSQLLPNYFYFSLLRKRER